MKWKQSFRPHKCHFKLQKLPGEVLYAQKSLISILNRANMLKIRLTCYSTRSFYMASLNFFFGSKKSSCYTKNPIIDPIFLLDYYFSVLEETKSPLNGFLSTQIKKLWVKSFEKPSYWSKSGCTWRSLNMAHIIWALPDKSSLQMHRNGSSPICTIPYHEILQSFWE